MTRVLTLALALTFAACGDSAPPPTRGELFSYTIVAEKPGQAGDLTVDVKVSATNSEGSIKTIAESIISARRARYQSVTVNTFMEGEKPVAVSKLEGGQISHAFNDEARGKQVRIPTH